MIHHRLKRMLKYVSFSIEKKHLTQEKKITFRRIEPKDVAISSSITHYRGEIVFMIGYVTSEIEIHESDIPVDLKTHTDLKIRWFPMYIKNDEGINFLEMYNKHVNIKCLNMYRGIESSSEDEFKPVWRNGQETLFQLSISRNYSHDTIAYFDFSQERVYFGNECIPDVSYPDKGNIMNAPQIINIIDMMLLSRFSYKKTDIFDVLGKKIRNGEVIDVDSMIKRIKASIEILPMDKLTKINEWIKQIE